MVLDGATDLLLSTAAGNGAGGLMGLTVSDLLLCVELLVGVVLPES